MADKKFKYEALPIDDILAELDKKPINEVFSVEKSEPPKGKQWRAEFFTILVQLPGRAKNVLKVLYADDFKIIKTHNEPNEKTGEFSPKLFTSKLNYPKMFKLLENIDKYVDHLIKTNVIVLGKNQSYFPCIATHYGSDTTVPIDYRGKEIVNSDKVPDPRTKFEVDMSIQKFENKYAKPGQAAPKERAITEIMAVMGDVSGPAKFNGAFVTNETVTQLIIPGSIVRAAEIDYSKLSNSKFGLSLHRIAKRMLVVPASPSEKKETAFDKLVKTKTIMGIENMKIESKPATQPETSMKSEVFADVEDDDDEDNDEEEDEEEEEEETEPVKPLVKQTAPPAKNTKVSSKKGKNIVTGL